LKLERDSLPTWTLIPNPKGASGSMHISICVCTYHRPELLRRLLDGLCTQETKGQFDYSIIVVDNDLNGSAKDTVQSFASEHSVRISYDVEPIRSISHARNRAIEHADGDLIAIIDDDEIPPAIWLYLLTKALADYKVSGVFGPVRPLFDAEPPKWIIRGRFFDRLEHRTGFIMPWKECRSGNILIKKEILNSQEVVFDPRFGAGASDIDLFRRLVGEGHTFIWCNEAYVSEVVSPNRWERGFMINRALLRGRISLLHPGGQLQSIFRSLVAIPGYALALPVLQLMGHHYFMKYLVNLFDHLGKILALIGLNPVRERKM
jgi:succinoglycan biosynthesis protein ExoM